MKIGVDMDSVIAEIMQPMVDFHNERYHTHLTLADHDDYDLAKVWQCDPADVLPRIFEYYESSHFENTRPVNGSVRGIGYLAAKYDLYLITSRPHLVEGKTNSWINRYFPDKFRKVLHTNQVSHQHEKRKKKSEVCREEGITMMIDDAVDYAVDCAQAGIQVYLFSASWNRNYPKHENIRKVAGWEEIITLL